MKQGLVKQDQPWWGPTRLETAETITLRTQPLAALTITMLINNNDGAQENPAAPTVSQYSVENPTLTLHINNIPTKMLIDTGATYSCLKDRENTTPPLSKKNRRLLLGSLGKYK